ncbi:TolB family protein [Nanoarchaeota archaeon]
MKKIITLTILLLLSLVACEEDQNGTPVVPKDRLSSIPADIVKITPQSDPLPPKLHSDEFEEPVQVPIISTAGAEDSPFFPANSDDFYFFFTPDSSIEAQYQLTDGVTGIWMSKRVNGVFQKPQRVMLQDKGKLALDGCPFVSGNTMLVCSAREGYAGIQWVRADFVGGKWTNWRVDNFKEEHKVGELHIHGDELYFHSDRPGTKGETDIWVSKRVGGEWQEPVNIEVVNTEKGEGMPYISANGNELWYHSWYQGAPAIFRSNKVNGEWQEPELIVERFAAEPTFDTDGNLYFAHHFIIDGKIAEADIYVAKKK